MEVATKEARSHAAAAAFEMPQPRTSMPVFVPPLPLSRPPECASSDDDSEVASFCSADEAVDAFVPPLPRPKSPLATDQAPSSATQPQRCTVVSHHALPVRERPAFDSDVVMHIRPHNQTTVFDIQGLWRRVTCLRCKPQWVFSREYVHVLVPVQSDVESKPICNSCTLRSDSSLLHPR